MTGGYSHFTAKRRRTRAPMTPHAAILLADAGPIPTTSLWEALWAGGPLVIPIIVCSFILVLVTFERLFVLRRARVAPKLFVERLLLQISEGALDRNQAFDLCDDDPSLVASVFAAAVRKWGKPAVEVEQAVLDEASAQPTRCAASCASSTASPRSRRCSAC